MNVRIAPVLAVTAVFGISFGCGEDKLIRGENGQNASAGRGAASAGRGGAGGSAAIDSGGVTSEARGGAGSAAEAGEAGAAGVPQASGGRSEGTAGTGGAQHAAAGRHGGAGHASTGDAGGASGGQGSGTDGGAGSETGGGAGSGLGGADGAEPVDSLVPNWSVHKRLRPATGGDYVLEETLQGFAEDAAAPSRIRELTADGRTARSYTPPAGTYISDFCRHPSGEFSAVLIAEDRSLSLARLAADLSLLGSSQLHDPDIANDPHVEGSVTELAANGFAPDAARVAANGEAAIVALISSVNSALAYRLVFATGEWGAPERTLIEPPVGLTPNLPIGGSFDTFGAMGAWFRCVLDIDEAGNAYVAIWAGQKRISVHTALFQDGLAPLPGDPAAPNAHDSDLLLTKLDPAGARVWSRVVGSEHEDEPYALSARGGFVAVVGRARRFPGFDNTTWDALLSVTSTDGELVGTRTLPLDASGILLAVDALPNGGWLLGGSDGWTQNPEGLSVVSFGNKLLLELTAFDAEPLRHALATGPRHNEVRTVGFDAERLWFGGHEDGPVMHTGDADPSAIHATGVLGSISR